MTDKCSHHKDKRRKIIQRISAGILIFIFIVLLVVLIVWAVLQPKKPRFILQDATIFSFNVSAANAFSTSIQVTIYSHNPNDRIGIYYDKSDVYATYHSQQVTYYTSIPAVYQGHKDVNVWSPFIFGNDIPIAPYNGQSLAQDQSNGGIQLKIKMDGRVKWKVGTVTTGHYHLHVTCPAYIPFDNKVTGLVVGTGIKYQLSQGCSVSL